MQFVYEREMESAVVYIHNELKVCWSANVDLDHEQATDFDRLNSDMHCVR